MAGSAPYKVDLAPQRINTWIIDLQNIYSELKNGFYDITRHQTDRPFENEAI